MRGRSSFSTVALFIAVMLVPFVVSAEDLEMKTVGNFGVWESLIGSDAGNQRCAIAAAKDQKAVYLAYIPETNVIAILLWKETWRIPKNKEIIMNIQVDNQKLHSLMGLGSDPEGHRIESDLFLSGKYHQDTMEFVNEVKAGQKILISFPDGTEAPWNINIAGASEAVESLLSCARMIAPGNTIETNKGADTQPFAVQSKYPEQTLANFHAGCMAPKNWQSKGIARELMETACDCFVREIPKAVSYDQYVVWERALEKGIDFDEQTKTIDNKVQKARETCFAQIRNSGLLERFKRN